MVQSLSNEIFVARAVSYIEFLFLMLLLLLNLESHFVQTVQ